MLSAVDFNYFSPTGGTLKCGELFCRALAAEVNAINLGTNGGAALPAPGQALAVFALPVFAGRLPGPVAEKLSAMDGHGKKAVALVVYGVRAYEDALLELNDILAGRGFEVVASAALVAEHSIVREVGKGRPDAADAREISAFAERALARLDQSAPSPISVPGSRPYRAGMAISVTPVSLPECGSCGMCVSVCPTGAIHADTDGIHTALEKCMMCMACVAACPRSARILPPKVQDGLTQKLRALVNVRRENEFFI